MSEENLAKYDPTEKTLYEEPYSDDVGTWQDRLYQCGDGPRKAIGIDVAGTVFVLPLKEWHELAAQKFKKTISGEDRKEL